MQMIHNSAVHSHLNLFFETVRMEFIHLLEAVGVLSSRRQKYADHNHIFLLSYYPPRNKSASRQSSTTFFIAPFLL